ncbi:DUF3618 domain-containing protein [Sphingomonas sp. CGMCC 1.13654]|uniref:DUF3618 domain-containing protein n=1 Tax=Sphingomonas chungangi TaxID=2683589 RepID=A0A838LBX1_9SPHN|nr:DUF3618 domain-containing protein [Sphingomonas chungangi]MBA2936215.1 DUF3618 domain-containing protein [Sphingomonas chungangi]MVW55600.1 DUF3618 domain-containing protein [Sphingomonas chungangi]
MTNVLKRLFSNINDVDVAQSQVEAARGRLMATIEQIQQRIAPSTLMDEAIEQVKTRSTELAQSAGKVVRDRPATVAATAAGIGLLLAAKPLSRLFGKAKVEPDETPALKRRSPRSRKSPKPAT